MHGAVTARLATTAEAYEQFRALGDEYETSLPPDLRHAGWPGERARVAAAYAHPNAAFTAQYNDASVGIVAFVRLDDARAVIKKLYVSPTARGLGVARLLIFELEGEAIRRGHDTLLLDTEPKRLSAAFRLYQSLGFTVCEPFAEVDYAGAVFMQRRLD